MLASLPQGTQPDFLCFPCRLGLDNAGARLQRRAGEAGARGCGRAGGRALPAQDNELAVARPGALLPQSGKD